MKLGFIGLGAMGAPMARNLLESGHELAVWNRSPERVDPLVEVGARRADSPADAGKLSIMVGGDEQTFEEFESVLAAMGDKVSHLGGVGSGARMKLINNLI